MTITLTVGPGLDVADLLLGLAHCENTRVAVYGRYNRLMAEGLVTDAYDDTFAVLDDGETTIHSLAEVEHIVIGSVTPPAERPLTGAEVAEAVRAMRPDAARSLARAVRGW